MSRDVAPKLKKAFRALYVKFAGIDLCLLIVMLSLSVVWNQSIKNELAGQSTKFIRRSLVSADMRAVIQTMNAVQLDSFESVSFYNTSGGKVITLPPSAVYDGSTQMTWLQTFLYGRSFNTIYINDTGRTPVGEIAFVYNRFGLAHYAFAIWFLVTLILGFMLRSAERKIKFDVEAEMSGERMKVLAELANKIRHDIRSPLAVLRTIAGEKVNPAKYIHHFNSAVSRIEEVVSEIDSQKSATPPINKTGSIWNLQTVISQVITEKKVLYPKMHFQVEWSETSPIYSSIDSARLKATASNILENAVQACDCNGQVRIAVQTTEDLVSIRVQDNGKGIAPENISKIFSEGFTHGKVGGSGLGLYFAKKLMTENGGNVSCESHPGRGTTISLLFPRRPAPSWHVPHLDIKSFSSIVIVDDQKTISDFWKKHMLQLGFRGSIECIQDPMRVEAKEKTLYLVDYDLGFGKDSGLDLIGRLRLGRRAILLTGHGHDVSVQRRSGVLGCGLIPKDEFQTLLANQSFKAL